MRRHFLTYYDALRKRLKYRLGSEDLANDVLHETWLRIEQRDEEQQIQNPQAYLYRTALNVAYDR
ncbi:RNA polymerase sigma factor, partial [Klebsiella pneumoniae]